MVAGLTLASCTQDATPVERDATSLGLSRDAFVSDAANDDAAGASDAVEDGTDLSDDATSVLGLPCDVVTACTVDRCCDEAVKCALTVAGLGSCSVAGSGEAGVACGSTGDDDCGAGLACVRLDDEPDALCRPFCDPDGVRGPGCSGTTACRTIRWAREPAGVCH